MLPDDWDLVTLADVADYRAGRTPSRANSSFWEGADATLPWVSIADMVEHQIVRETKEKVTPKAAETAFRGRYSPAGTLLMSYKLTIGRVATLGVDAFHNEAIISIFPKEGFDQRYLGYWLSQVDYDRLHDRQIKGNTLNQEKIDRIPVARPPETEQARIADVLDAVRTAISTQTDSLEATTSLKRVSMRELFTRGLRGEVQKDSEIGPVPDSWDVVDFGSVRRRLQYGTSVRCAATPTPFPVLRIPNIGQGKVDATDLKYAHFNDRDAANHRLENGDMIFIRTNGVLDRLGCCAVFEGQPEGALFASYLIRAQPNLEVLNPWFAAHFYGSPVGTGIIAGRATPAADGKYNLNTGIIDSLPIPLPPTTAEQEEIAVILDSIDAKIDLHKRKKAVLEELFHVLLHKLMTGEIRVADLNLSALDPPANGAVA